jgi:hypothetical protein
MLSVVPISRSIIDQTLRYFEKDELQPRLEICGGAEALSAVIIAITYPEHLRSAQAIATIPTLASESRNS